MQTTRNLSAEQRATMLAESFHSLEGAPGVRPWNAEKLDQWASTVASNAERHAAAFVLEVYNVFAEWKSGPFRAVDAYCTWDRDNMAAFRAWVERPYTL